MAIVPNATTPGYVATAGGAIQFAGVGYAATVFQDFLFDASDSFTLPVLVVGFNSFMVSLVIAGGGDTFIDLYAWIVEPLSNGLIGSRIPVVSSGAGTAVGTLGASSAANHGAGYVWHTLEFELVGTGGVVGSFVTINLWAARR